ncbi:MAG: hypothetical protein IKE58_10015 [Blautia sp.]|nr:hypothetical protein [Blautia sp.]
MKMKGRMPLWYRGQILSSDVPSDEATKTCCEDSLSGKNMGSKRGKVWYPLALLLCVVLFLGSAAMSSSVTAASKAALQQKVLTSRIVTMVTGEYLKPSLPEYSGTIYWKVKDTKVISVNNGTGIWTALRKGSTLVRGEFGNQSVILKVNVQEPKLKARSITCYKGYRTKLGFSGTDQQARWISSHPQIAYISPTGQMTACRVGKAVIRGTIHGVPYECIVTVKNRPVSHVTSTPTPTPRPIRIITSTPRPTPTPKPVVKPRYVVVTCTPTPRPSRPYRVVYVTATPTPAPLYRYVTATPVPVYRYATPTPISYANPYVYIPQNNAGIYHRIPNCGNMNPATAVSMLRSNAISLGYRPCSNCWH